MEEEERQRKIDDILSTSKGGSLEKGIPIRMFLIGQEDPTNPEWLEYCQQVVDDCYRRTGKRDTTSTFAKCLRYAKRKEASAQ